MLVTEEQVKVLEGLRQEERMLHIILVSTNLVEGIFWKAMLMRSSQLPGRHHGSQCILRLYGKNSQEPGQTWFILIDWVHILFESQLVTHIWRAFMRFCHKWPTWSGYSKILLTFWEICSTQGSIVCGIPVLPPIPIPCTWGPLSVATWWNTTQRSQDEGCNIWSWSIKDDVIFEWGLGTSRFYLMPLPLLFQKICDDDSKWSKMNKRRKKTEMGEG